MPGTPVGDSVGEGSASGVPGVPAAGDVVGAKTSVDGSGVVVGSVGVAAVGVGVVPVSVGVVSVSVVVVSVIVVSSDGETSLSWVLRHLLIPTTTAATIAAKMMMAAINLPLPESIIRSGFC